MGIGNSKGTAAKSLSAVKKTDDENAFKMAKANAFSQRRRLLEQETAHIFYRHRFS